jgi:hypothetical protein
MSSSFRALSSRKAVKSGILARLSRGVTGDERNDLFQAAGRYPTRICGVLPCYDTDFMRGARLSPTRACTSDPFAGSARRTAPSERLGGRLA